jgi:hypothetical protein
MPRKIYLIKKTENKTNTNEERERERERERAWQPRPTFKEVARKGSLERQFSKKRTERYDDEDEDER